MSVAEQLGDFIVILPRDIISDRVSATGAESGADALIDAKALKKARQRFLRRAFSEQEAGVRAKIAHVHSPESVIAAPPKGHVGVEFGAVSASDIGSIRALDAVGALIITDPAPGILDALTAAGATVAENAPVDLVEPIEPIVGQGGAEAKSRGPDFWHLAHIGLNPQACQEFGQGACIGFLDTGIDPHHLDFKGRKVQFCAFPDARANRSMTARDFGTHGTHVAGIAARIACKANIAMAAVLTGKNGRGTIAQVLAGLQWLVEEAFKDCDTVPIINASLSAPGSIDVLQTPFEARGENVLIVAASGNDGSSVGSPGCFAGVLTVGATDKGDNVAQFSNWSPGSTKPDLCAPGVEIWSARVSGGHVALSGTSMAAPIVAGLAARYASDKSVACSDVTSLRTRLLRGAVQAKPAHRAGAGRVDVR